jgi:hypothetical protein
MHTYSAARGILLTGSGYESWGIALLLLLLVFLCYFVVLVICLRRKWESLKKLVSETGLALCFIIIGLVIQEMTGTFLEIKDEIAIVYALIGFLIAELVTPNGPMKALRALLNSVIRHRLHFLVVYSCYPCLQALLIRSVRVHLTKGLHTFLDIA